MAIHTPRRNAGIRLYMGAAPGAEPTVEVGGVIDMGDLGDTSQSIDVTTLADTARRRMKGLRDGGEQTIRGNFDPEDVGQMKLQAAVGYDSAYKFKAELPLGSKKYVVEWNAHVMAFQVTPGSIDGVVQFSADLAVDGKRVADTVAA